MAIDLLTAIINGILLPCAVLCLVSLLLFTPGKAKSSQKRYDPSL